MTNVDTGITGAKRQSFHEESPRDLLKRLMKANAKLSEEDLLILFARKVNDNPKYLPAIIEYWFANNHRSLTTRPQSPQQRRQDETTRRQKIDTLKQGYKEQLTKLAFLAMVLPNGKELRECTGSECRKMAPKVGAFLAKLGKELKPNQKVGDVYASDDALAKLWR